MLYEPDVAQTSTEKKTLTLDDVQKENLLYIFVLFLTYHNIFKTRIV